ncbi:BTB-domain-containing protein pipsqueak [Rhynchophorus ferrugineus]|uniref:BTB-domain-containing protein pipsqueak n=1 Tax=Rhynchophorus ferrugineus TaxID=354439 RepID=UPI003FCC9402
MRQHCDAQKKLKDVQPLSREIKGLYDNNNGINSIRNIYLRYIASRHSSPSSKQDTESRKLNSEDNNNRQYKHRRLQNQNYTNKESKNKRLEFTRTARNYSRTTENEMPIALDEHKNRKQQRQDGFETRHVSSLNMSSNGLMAGQAIFSTFDSDDFPPEPPAPSAVPVRHVDMADHTAAMLANTPIHRTDLSDATTKYTMEIKKEVDIKFETLRSFDQDSLLEMDSHMSGEHSMGSHEDVADLRHQSMINPDFTQLQARLPGRIDMNDTGDNGDLSSIKSNGHSDNMHQNSQRPHSGGGPKTWTQEDMDMALDALKNHNMSLTKASATYGIPSTTLWQRAHRLGIDTPKKEGPTKSWTEENLNNALEALRTGTISANKASKAYGIPSSTLYKIARREGIRLAAPFNAAPTTWTPEDLEKALESIRTGQTSVQKASTEFGIPTGTLYGRCKREGIELSRSNPTPWSEDAMGEALEAVRLGHMSINQAAIHYNLPYSSLYGRFKRGIKYDSDNIEVHQENTQAHMEIHPFAGIEFNNGQPHIQYHSQPNS